MYVYVYVYEYVYVYVYVCVCVCMYMYIFLINFIYSLFHYKAAVLHARDFLYVSCVIYRTIYAIGYLLVYTVS